MSPKLHNTLSYSVACLCFVAFVPWHNSASWLVATLWSFHFVRRSLEAQFVHRYGGRRVPPSDYLVEYIYYWGFAAWIAWSLREPGWSLPSAWVTAFGIIIFAVGEMGNAWAHLKLRALRTSAGETRRRVPQGGLFNWVSCPHYLFEIMTWCGFAWLTQVLASYVFLALGSIIVSTYARARHQRYRADFDGKDGREFYPNERTAIIPWIL